MATITLRQQKGSPLTNQEIDDNFLNLNNNKLELSGGTLTGNLSVPQLTSSYSSGDTGGTLLLNKPSSNTTINTSVSIKLYQNKLQFSETNGSYRGAWLDITGSANDIGSLILTSTNYNSYSPTLGGIGATGTWPVSITGNSATVTSITSSQVTSALGYTPYSSTNPSNFISANQTITLSGDVSGSGNTGIAVTLANSGVTAGTYGSSTNIPQIIVNAKGLITSVSNVAVSIPSGSLTFTGDVTGTGTTGSSTTLTLANSGVTAGTYNTLTVDSKGRVTSGSNTSYLPLSGGTLTGNLTGTTATFTYNYTYTNSDVWHAAFGASSSGKQIRIGGNTTNGGVIGSYADGTNSSPNNLSIQRDGGTVSINQNGVTYSTHDNTPVVGGGATTNRLHVNGSIQLTNNDDAFVIGRGTATFLKDEELGFGWGGGWYMIDNDWVRVRNNKNIYTTGIIRSDGDIRAPIFYDSNDTGYYGDFNNGGVKAWRNSGYSGGISVADDGGYLTYRITTNNHSDSWQWQFTSNDITAGSGTKSFWVTYNGNHAYAAGSMRAPIFYDNNDTGFYIDPTSSTSSLKIAGAIELGENYAFPNIEWAASGSSTGMVIFKLPGGSGNYGMVHMVFDYYEYDSPRTATIIVSGHNWNSGWYNVSCNVVGYIDKQVRVGFKDGQYCVVFGTSGSGWSYGTIRLRKIHNGSFYNNIMDLGGSYSVAQTTTESFAMVSGDLRDLRVPTNFYAYSSIRSPIFYDLDDTGYYVNPNSGSNLAGDVRTDQFYCRGWFRNDNSNNGLYNQATTQHWSSNTNGYWDASSTTSVSAIRFYTGGHVSSLRGYVYADSSNSIGFLHSGGGWRLRVVSDDYTLVEGSSARAPIFYDSNDTNYYIDSNGTSNLSTLNIADGNLQLYKHQTVDLSNTGVYSTSNYYPVIIYVPTAGLWIEIQNNLNSNVPSWSTHPGGFSLNLRWWTNGSGWGTTEVKRRVEQYHERFTNSTICGGISQLLHSSEEVVWLRGGGTYYFKFSRNVTAYPQSTNYTNAGLTASVTSTAVNTVWNSATGSHTSYNTSVYADTRIDAPIFYDYNDTNYYLDPASGSRFGVQLAISGNASGSVGNRLIVGDTTVNYSLQDANLRPTIQANGQYPVLSLNHTVTSNTNHGPTIQMTANGVGNQFVIGMTGNGSALDMGYSSVSDWNPHNGIAGYNGTTFFRATSGGYMGLGAVGDWGGAGGGDPGYHLHFKGYNNAQNGYAAVFENTISGANNGGGFLFQNNNSNHSWGVAAEIRTVAGAGGADRPSLLFSTNHVNTSWSIGFVSGTDDTFRIVKNHGHRAYYGGWADTNSGWGTPYFTISSSGAATSVVDIRSPIFYDSNDTSYYINPNGTSQLNLVYANDWFRPQGNTGLYFQTYGYGIWAAESGSNSYGNATTYGTGRNGWTGWGLHSRFCWMSDHNNGGNTMGIHDNSLGWVWRWIPDSYFTVDRGYSVFANSARAPIFYDSNDTTYYLDLNGTSNASTTMLGAWYFRSNRNTDSNSPPLQAYSNDGGGAIMSFHRGGYYAVNFGLDSDNVIRIGGWSASTNRWQLDMSGNGTFAGNVTAYSDIRLKENIQTITNALSKVRSIRGVTFTRNDQEDKLKLHLGVIAQEVEQILPEIISQDNDGIKNVAYGNMVALLIEAIKEQQQQFDKQQQELQELKNLVKELLTQSR